jgi:hypothetical protein
MKARTSVVAIFIWLGGITLNIAQLAEKPAVEIEKAIEKSKDFINQKSEVDKYFIDRIWLQADAKKENSYWIVSWSPDLKNRKAGDGWHFVKVDMKGKAEEFRGKLPWVNLRKRGPSQ